MGGYDQIRNFLLTLFPECFHATLDELGEGAYHFDIMIIDMMQFLGQCVKNRTDDKFVASDVNRNMVDSLRFYMNNENDLPKRVTSDKFVVLFDSPLYVPRNKATTQLTRDLPTNRHTNEQDEGRNTLNDGDMEEIKQTNITGSIIHDNNEEDLMNEDSNESVINERQFNEILLEYMVKTDNCKSKYSNNMSNSDDIIPDVVPHPTNIIIDRNMPFLEKLKGGMVWRSNVFKYQLLRMVTHEILAFITIPLHKCIIIEDGIAVSDKVVDATCKRILTDYKFENRSKFDQACLISQFMMRNMANRLIVYSDKKVVRNPVTQVGESDVKIIQYIRTTNGLKKHLVVSQDIIFILLLHMKRLLASRFGNFSGTKEGEGKEEMDIWIDTQTPSDARKNNNRSYRYIHVTKLYHSIISLFAKEYPSITTPIETFIFMVFSLKTDFTLGFHKCLGITHLQVWNTFSELHHPRPQVDETIPNINRPSQNGLTPMKPKSLSRNGSTVSKKDNNKDQDAGFIMFQGSIPNKGIKRSSLRLWDSTGMDDILSDAIKVEYDHSNEDIFLFRIDVEKWTTFFSLLCQISMINDKCRLELCQTYPSNHLKNKNVVRYIAPKGSEINTKRIYIPDHSIVLAYAEDIVSVVRQYAQKKNKESREVDHTLLEVYKQLTIPDKESRIMSKQPINYNLSKGFKPSLNEMKSNPLPKLSNNQTSSSTVVGNIVNNPIYYEHLDKLLAQNIPDRYGIPNIHQLRARFMRIKWIMEYSQNAGFFSVFGQCYSDVSPIDSLISVYGWKQVKVDTRLYINSSYHSHISSKQEENIENKEDNGFPFESFQTIESEFLF